MLQLRLYFCPLQHNDKSAWWCCFLRVTHTEAEGRLKACRWHEQYLKQNWPKWECVGSYPFGLVCFPECVCVFASICAVTWSQLTCCSIISLISKTHTFSLSLLLCLSNKRVYTLIRCTHNYSSYYTCEDTHWGKALFNSNHQRLTLVPTMKLKG